MENLSYQAPLDNLVETLTTQHWGLRNHTEIFFEM